MRDTGSLPGAAQPGSRTFWERLYGALTLDATVFEEVEHDARDGLVQACGVVALASVARGIGYDSFLPSLLGGFIGWLFATAVIWIIGVKVLEHTSDYRELLRTVGFATAPRVLLVFGLILPGPLRALLSLFVLFLTVVNFVLAVRQALDVETGRAVFICAVGAIVNLIPSLILGGLAWL
jgi:hypothetical protein